MIEVDDVEQKPSIHEIDFGQNFNDIWSNAMSNSECPRRRCSNGDDDHEESRTNIRFSPPAYIQRYQAVLDILTQYRGKLHKIVEFGCAELAFCVYLKNLDGLEEVLFVDIDRVTLDKYKMRAKPLHVDFLHRRSRPLVLRILEGSITQPDRSLENCDAVVCIELVEHLYPEPLTNLPYNVFGFIKPQVAIITTPNSEFNVLFTNLKGFRHPDHKFEWTRSQFQDWAHNIISRFPDYEVSFHGICNGPPGSEHLGACTQMAVFHKIIDDSHQQKVRSVPGLYKTVEVYEFPYEIDNRSDEQKILDDAIYFIKKISYIGDGEYMEEIPLQKLLNFLSKFNITIEQLTDILINGNFNVVNTEEGPVVIVPSESDTFSDNDMAEGDFSGDIPSDQYCWGNENSEPNVDCNHDHNHSQDIYTDEAWDSDPDIINQIEVVRSNDDCFSELETANSTASIYPDDICLDDIVVEDRSTELANSNVDVSVTISSFSETKDSENCPNSFSHSETVSSSSYYTADLNNSYLSLQSLEKTNLEDIINNTNDSSICKNDSMCSMYLEPSCLSTYSVSEDLIDPLLNSTITSPENHVYNKSTLNNSVIMNNTHENTFEKPDCTSSPHVLLTTTCDRKKITNQKTGPSTLNSKFNRDDDLSHTNDEKLDVTSTSSNKSVIEGSNLR